MAHRADDGRGAAQAALDEVAVEDLLELDGAFDDVHAAVVLGHHHQRAAGDGGQDGVRVALGDDQVALLVDEEDVGAARNSRNWAFWLGVLPGLKRFSPVSVVRDQLSCLPEPLTPAKGFSWYS